MTVSGDQKLIWVVFSAVSHIYIHQSMVLTPEKLNVFAAYTESQHIPEKQAHTHLYDSFS